MKKKQVKSLSIKDGRLRCSFEQCDSLTGDVSNLTYENASAIHPDLSAAVQKLKVHVCRMTGLPVSDNLIVQGYRKQGVGDSWLITFYSSVIPFGGKEQRSNLATRIYVGRDNYEWTERLLKELEHCEKEAMKYMEKGKRFESDGFIRIDGQNLCGEEVAA